MGPTPRCVRPGCAVPFASDRSGGSVVGTTRVRLAVRVESVGVAPTLAARRPGIRASTIKPLPALAVERSWRKLRRSAAQRFARAFGRHLFPALGEQLAVVVATAHCQRSQPDAVRAL